MNSHFNPTAVAPPDEGSPLRHGWHILLERRWLIISVFCLTLLASLIWVFRAIPIYQAVATLQIDPEQAGVMNLREGTPFQPKDIEYFKTQEQNLRSRSLIEKVANHRDLNLREDPRYKSKVDWLKAVADDISIEPIRLTRLIRVRVFHPDRKRATDIASKLIAYFLEANSDRKRSRSFDGFRALKQEAASQETELENANGKLAEYRRQNQATSLEEDSDVITKSFIEAKKASDEAASRADRVGKIAENALKWKAGERDLADFPEIAADTAVAHLKGELVASQALFAGTAKRYGPKHKNYQKVFEAVVVQKEKLKAEAERTFQGLIETAKIEKQNAEQSFEKFQKAEQAKSSLSGLKGTYDIYTRKKETAEIIYRSLITKLKEYELLRSDTIQNMNVIDPPFSELKPVRPPKALIISSGILGGLGLAIGLAFLLNHLDDSVKSQEDVENYLKLPFLGYIPNIKSASVVERDLQAHFHPTSSAAEGFRTLRASVALARNAEKLHNIAVSSTIPSEGKSLVASNFAIVTAQTGLRTLLVDADLRRPSVHKAFQLQSPIGLATYLADRVQSVDEIIHSTEIEHLDVVCSGAIPSNPSELVGSKRMAQFLAEVSKRYDRVVVDCPPVSAVADPLVIGAMCDGLLFVTKFNKIRREHALRSVQRIQDAGIHTIGLVLNDIDFEGKDSYYYSYHYYQNRYYASHYRKQTTDAIAKQAEESGKASKS